jgi:hypothetical protein
MIQHLKRIILTALLGLIALFSSFQLNGQELTKKWFPGHYVAIRYLTNPVDESGRNLVKDNPYITGYKMHVVWSEIETARDVYDFSVIEEVVKMAESDNKKLLIHVQDRLFGRNSNPYLPAYMLGEEFEGGWFNSSISGASYGKVWLPAYQERWNKLLRAIGEAFDNNPTVAGIMVSESSMNTKTEGYDKAGHHAFIKGMSTTMSLYAPNTIFFQYVNWGFTPEDREMLMQHIVEECKNGFGGPDIMNAEPRWGGITKYVLKNAFGSYYDKYRGIAPICTENQSGGYWANDAKTLFDYAVDQVGVHFLPWTIYSKTDRAWSFEDALRVINEEKGRINTTPPSNLIRNGAASN